MQIKLQVQWEIKSVTNVFELIEKYTSSPPVQLESLIRDLGIELDKKSELPDGIAGQLERLPSGGYKISINKNDFYFRQRFTMAHELGHFVLHRSLIGNGIVDNALYRSVASGNMNNTLIHLAHEVEANKFAASLIMPYEQVSADYDEIKDIKEVAKKWQVSPQALKIRLNLK
jgi:predicted transcriptional regulator